MTNTRLKRRIEALESKLPEPRDLRQEILVEAMATALTPDELEFLRASAGEDGTVPIPPDWRPRLELALKAVTRERTDVSLIDKSEETRHSRWRRSHIQGDRTTAP